MPFASVNQREKCDKCGDITLVQNPEQKNTFLSLGNDEGRYHFDSKGYVLCIGCSQEVADWIEGEENTKTSVDKVALDTAVETLEKQSEYIQSLAERLDALSEDDVEDR